MQVPTAPCHLASTPSPNCNTSSSPPPAVYFLYIVYIYISICIVCTLYECINRYTTRQMS